MQLKAVVIGLGNIARKAHLSVIMTNDRLNVVGIMAKTRRTVDEIGERYRIAGRFLEIDQILKQKPDCAFVLTPADTHRDIVMKLLEAGVDVFVEKPLAPTPADAEMVVQAAREHGRVLMVGFNRRYAPFYQRAHELFAGTGPDLCLIQKHRKVSRLNYVYDFKGTLLDDAIHIIDLLRWFMGDDFKALNLHGKYLDGRFMASMDAEVFYQKGSSGILAMNREAGQDEESVLLFGSGISVKVRGMDVLEVSSEGHTTITKHNKWAETVKRRGFIDMADHFIDCVLSRSEPLTSGTEALKTQLLAEKLYANAQIV